MTNQENTNDNICKSHEKLIDSLARVVPRYLLQSNEDVAKTPETLRFLQWAQKQAKELREMSRSIERTRVIVKPLVWTKGNHKRLLVQGQVFSTVKADGYDVEYHIYQVSEGFLLKVFDDNGGEELSTKRTLKMSQVHAELDHIKRVIQAHQELQQYLVTE